MGLINIPNLEDNQVLPANDLNERFGTIAAEINGNLDSANLKNGAVTASKIADDAMNRIYPVGSLYFNGSVDTNPGTLLGFGTWEAYAAGRVPVGVDTNQTEFNAVGKESGSKTHFHWQTFGSDNNVAYAELDGAGSGHTSIVNVARTLLNVFGTQTAPARRDGTYDESSLQPSVAVYIWRRTA